MKARFLFPLFLFFAVVAGATDMATLGLVPAYRLGTPTPAAGSTPAINSLGTPTPGNVRQCTNCMASNPCAAGTPGVDVSIARAEVVSGTAVWNCGGGSSSTPVPGSGGNLIPFDEGTPVATPTRPAFNCVGNITCSNDAANGWTKIDVPTPAAGGGSLEVKEIDGTPDVSGVSIIQVTNGTLTDNGSGNVTITIGGGGTTKPFWEWSANQFILPASAYAQFTTRNAHPVLAFDASTDECGYLEGVLSPAYGGGGITVDIDWLGASATSGATGWLTAFERHDSATDLDSDSFASNKSASTTTNGTSGAPTRTSIAHSNSEIDSLAAGESFRLRVCRDGDGSVVTDSMTGDAQIVHVDIREP